ncbi:hypothetical protein [Aquimarina longa]|uniref:hypothetical protein n=1 Tax=Aquimarina longa TaxID=1080221 RepID=UPI0007854748|nr:hypothetical protein [Aquimarina longa]
MANYLEHRIFEKPRYTHSYEVQPHKGATIAHLDDEKLICDRSYALKANWEFGLMLLAIGVSFFIFTEGNSSVLSFIFVLVGLLGLLMVIYGLFRDKKKERIILDRLNGTITYPIGWFQKPISGRFSRLDVVIGTSGATDGYAHREYLNVINTWQPTIFGNVKTLSYDNPPIKAWSFFVWYMDKNRPLPNGTAFDPYREKDRKRREAEGNPPPLYPSNIDTPYDMK